MDGDLRIGRRAALTSPIVLLLLGSLLVQLAYVLYDYIGWTHAFPLLPYHQPSDDSKLRAELASSCASKGRWRRGQRCG